jgi:hypothetical protein
MNRMFATAPLAFLVSTGFLFAAAGPAMAADARCATLPMQLRELAVTADPSSARKALGYVSIGEKLCEAGNERAGVKKFTAAMRTLGTQEAQQLASRDAGR